MKRIIIGILAAMLTLVTAVAIGLFWIRPTVIDRQRQALESELIGLIKSGQMEFASFEAPPVEGEDEIFPELNSYPQENAECSFTACSVLAIPSIGLEMPVAEAADSTVLRAAAGWRPDSALIGSQGNCIIYGYRLSGYGRHFNRLDELKAGDSIMFTDANGDTVTYLVTDCVVVKPEELAERLSRYAEKAMLTLVTDRGTGAGSHRLLVFAELDDSVG